MPASDLSQRRLFSQHLHRQIDLVKIDCHNVILLGDFNVAESDVIDWSAGRASKDSSPLHLSPTICSGTTVARAARTSPSIPFSAYNSRQYRNLKSDVVPFVHSYHDVVEIAIRTTTILPGNGLWALDKDMLQEEPYRQMITFLLRH